MTTNAQRGTQFEREVRADLVRRGYVVVRSTVSKTPLDLMALWSQQRTDPEWSTEGSGLWRLPAVTVQAKRDGRLDPGEWNVLYGLASSSETTAVLARREPGRRVVIGYYVLLGRKISGQRHPPLVRVYPPEAPDGEV